MEHATQVRPAARARVLFVDDEPDMTTALRRVVSREPFEACVANTVSEAFALMAEQEFDVVVSDELMPDMSGSEFLRQVRTAHPYTVRILLTGKASLDTAIQAVNRAGIFRFLQKPCSAQDLIESLRDAIDHHNERSLNPPPSCRPPTPSPSSYRAATSAPSRAFGSPSSRWSR